MAQHVNACDSPSGTRWDVGTRSLARQDSATQRPAPVGGGRGRWTGAGIE